MSNGLLISLKRQQQNPRVINAALNKFSMCSKVINQLAKQNVPQAHTIVLGYNTVTCKIVAI